MVRQVFLISMLIAACMVISAVAPGCGPEFTPIDTVEEPGVASYQRFDNWKETTASVHDGVLQDLEDRFQTRLLATDSQAEAAKEPTLYPTMKTEPPQNELVDLETYAKVLDSSLSVHSPSKPGQEISAVEINP